MQFNAEILVKSDPLKEPNWIDFLFFWEIILLPKDPVLFLFFWAQET